MSSVEIIVGHRWKDDVRYIDSLRPRRPAESCLDLLELRDIIDIVVDGTNLTASIPEEAIFGLVGRVLSALVKLVDETSHKGIIEFHHEPWELVLVPDGTSLRLSLYSIDRRQRVIARDQRIDARAFINAICGVGEQMLTDLFSVSERFSSHQQVRQISQALAHLKRAPRIEFSQDAKSRRPGAGDMRLASTSTAQGLTLAYRFDGSDPGLIGYQGEHVFDLHSLLFEGILEAEFNSHNFLLAHQYPFWAVTSLLDRTRQLFNQLESRSKTDFVLDEELSHLGFCVESKEGEWRIRARDTDDDTWHECTVSPSNCLDTLVSLGELFVQDLLRANASLAVNQRFIDLEEEVEKLRLWHRDLCGNTFYHERPEDYLRRLADVEPAAPASNPSPDFPRPLASIHTLFPRRAWNLWAERIDFSSLTLTETSLLVATPKSIRSLSPQRGNEHWRRQFEVPVDHDGVMSVAGPHLVATEGDGRLLLLDRQTGSLTSQLKSSAKWRDLVGAASYEKQDRVVVGRRDGEVAGFDATSGQMQWSHSTSPGKLRGLLFHGPLVCTQSCEGVISALNPCSGEPVWKIRTGGTPELSATVHQGRIYAVTHDPLHGGSTLYALYPFTGRTIWQLRLPGYACGPPSFVDQWMMLPLERHGQLTLIGVDLEAVDPRVAWQLELSSAGVDRPTPVSPAMIDGEMHGLIRTDRAELTCFRVLDGEILWRVVPATETLLLHGNLPLFQVRDAVVNVSSTVDLRHLETGRLLHSFDAIEAPEFGFLAPPFCVLLGERLSRSDDADQIAAYSVEHFLALID